MAPSENLSSPDGSDGKECACNVGDSSSMSGWEDLLEKGIATTRDFPGGSEGKASVYNVGDPGLIPGLGDPLEKETAAHSSSLACKIPWMEGPGELQSMGLQRVRTTESLTSNLRELHWVLFPNFLPIPSQIFQLIITHLVSLRSMLFLMISKLLPPLISYQKSFETPPPMCKSDNNNFDGSSG